MPTVDEYRQHWKTLLEAWQEAHDEHVALVKQIVAAEQQAINRGGGMGGTVEQYVEVGRLREAMTKLEKERQQLLKNAFPPA